jgi:hypothetical protein
MADVQCFSGSEQIARALENLVNDSMQFSEEVDGEDMEPGHSDIAGEDNKEMGDAADALLHLDDKHEGANFPSSSAAPRIGKDAFDDVDEQQLFRLSAC